MDVPKVPSFPLVPALVGFSVGFSVAMVISLILDSRKQPVAAVPCAGCAEKALYVPPLPTMNHEASVPTIMTTYEDYLEDTLRDMADGD